jgi:hypothetical protein
MIADNQQGQALCYVFGVYFGDGSVTRRFTYKDGTENKCFQLSTIDRDFRDYAAEQAALAFPDSKPYLHEHQRGKNRVNYTLRVDNVGTYIEQTAGKKTVIPNFVYASRENSKACREGLLDSEGWATDTTYLKKDHVYLNIGIAIGSELMHEFRRMFETFGIKCGKMHTRKLDSGRVMKQMSLSTVSFLESGLEFHCWRIQRRIEAHRWARKVLGDITASKLPDGVSFNDYKQSVRKQVITSLQSMV